MASFPAWVRTWFNNKVEGASFRTVSVTRPEDAESFEDDHNDFALALYERLPLSLSSLTSSRCSRSQNTRLDAGMRCDISPAPREGLRRR